MCAVHCVELLHTILHRTDLIIIPLALQTITTAPMMSIWGKGGCFNDRIQYNHAIGHAWHNSSSYRMRERPTEWDAVKRSIYLPVSITKQMTAASQWLDNVFTSYSRWQIKLYIIYNNQLQVNTLTHAAVNLSDISLVSNPPPQIWDTAPLGWNPAPNQRDPAVCQ